MHRVQHRVPAPAWAGGKSQIGASHWEHASLAPIQNAVGDHATVKCHLQHFCWFCSFGSRWLWHHGSISTDLRLRRGIGSWCWWENPLARDLLGQCRCHSPRRVWSSNFQARFVWCWSLFCMCSMQISPIHVRALRGTSSSPQVKSQMREDFDPSPCCTWWFLHCKGNEKGRKEAACQTSFITNPRFDCSEAWHDKWPSQPGAGSPRVCDFWQGASLSLLCCAIHGMNSRFGLPFQKLRGTMQLKRSKKTLAPTSHFVQWQGTNPVTLFFGSYL